MCHRLPAEPRTVILHRARKGFGFVLRGAKAMSPLMELQPSERCPALQYLDDVDQGGVADMAGLRKGDYLLAVSWNFMKYLVCHPLESMWQFVLYSSCAHILISLYVPKVHAVYCYNLSSDHSCVTEAFKVCGTKTTDNKLIPARYARLAAMQGSASRSNVCYYPMWKYSPLKERIEQCMNMPDVCS
jgi:hypothetical protein